MPSHLERISNQMWLELDGNGITEISKISELKMLSVLNLDNNMLTHVPECIKGLPSLTVVKLSNVTFKSY